MRDFKKGNTNAIHNESMDNPDHITTTRTGRRTVKRLSRISNMEIKAKQEPKTGKNPIAQRLIKAMEKPPHLTHEDVEALCQSIEAGKMPLKFNSPFNPDEREKIMKKGVIGEVSPGPR